MNKVCNASDGASAPIANNCGSADSNKTAKGCGATASAEELIGLIKGEIRPIADKIGKTLKVPHIGWNSLEFTDKKSEIFKYISDGDFVYFVHSYYAANCEESVIAKAEYGAKQPTWRPCRARIASRSPESGDTA